MWPVLPAWSTAGIGLAVLVRRVDQHGRADRVEIPDVMGDVLEVADVLAGVEIERDQRVGVEVVAGTDRAVEVGRGIADHEIDAVGRQVDRRDSATRRRRASCRGRRSWRARPSRPAMSRCMSRPVASLVAQTPTEFSGIVSKVQSSLPVVGVVGLDEAADAVFAAVGADQDLALDRGRRHRLAVALLRIGDVAAPDDRRRSWRRARPAWRRASRDRPCRRDLRRRDCWGRSRRS